MEYQLAAGNAGWRFQFRYPGGRHPPRVAVLWALGSVRIMQTFTDLLHSVGKKPGLYLGFANGSVTQLKTFITGLQCGQRLQDNPSVLDSFTFWVCHHYHVPDGARDWSGHLLERAGGDEAATFRLFFQHFEEYLKERETIGAEAIKARFIMMLKQRHKDEDNAA